MQTFQATKSVLKYNEPAAFHTAILITPTNQLLSSDLALLFLFLHKTETVSERMAEPLPPCKIPIGHFTRNL